MTQTPADRVGWLDCASGVSGDMLLGALHGITDGSALADVLAATPSLGASVVVTDVHRAGLAAAHVQVQLRDDVRQPPRRLAEVAELVASMPLPAVVRERALRVFDRLARAEGAVHGVGPDEVHFHEVGAVDSIIDVVGVCLLTEQLAVDRLVVSPIALGGGTAATAHGTVPVPTPAVLRLLADSALRGYGGGDHELATPTGVALLAELADATGPMPPMSVAAVGVGAGSRDDAGRANVVRLVVGEPLPAAGAPAEEWLLLEANVDDLDPRLWPTVIAELLDAGAVDAWLTPILMKKGRPAHTLAALTAPEAVDGVRRAMFEQSSTIGVRTTVVAKHGLDRKTIQVDVEGQPIGVKVALLDGVVLNVSPEWEDVAAAARVLGRPAKTVLAAATAAASRALD